MWTNTHPMLERAAFIDAHARGVYSTAELAQRFSRKSAYEWPARSRDDGPQDLADRKSRRTGSPYTH